MTLLQPKKALNLREKLIDSGAKSLSDSELLAVFIGSGNKNKSCLDLAYELQAKIGDLRAILNADLKTFKQVKGLNEARYTQLQALKEISLRSDFLHLKKSLSLKTSKESMKFMKRQLRDRKHETFAALFLDSQYRVISYEELFSGTINAASIYTRPIIERSLHFNAAALIVAHNHPSGLCEASSSDVVITQRLEQALKLIDVELLESLVIGDNEVFSIMSQTKYLCH